MAITNCIRFDDDVRFALDQHAYFDFYGASSLKQLVHGTSLDMSLHLDTLSRFRANQSLLFLIDAACLAEKQQIPISVFSLTRQELEHTIYRNRGDHANHYTTDAFHIF